MREATDFSMPAGTSDAIECRRRKLLASAGHTDAADVAGYAASCKAANALANQPEQTDANTRHLHDALSGIRELANTDWLARIPARNI